MRRPFTELLDEMRERFPTGSFELAPDASIREAVREALVPGSPGVYLCSEVKSGAARIVRIGRSGVILNDGSPGSTGLDRHLIDRRPGGGRSLFWQDLIAARSLDALRFDWFVTVGERDRVLPSLVAATMLQTHLDQYGRLPDLNRSA